MAKWVEKLLGEGSDVLAIADLFRAGEGINTGCTKLFISSGELIAT